MAVLLTILKITGVVLITILSLIIIILLLILLMPIHYEASGVYKDGDVPRVNARINWLFCIIRVRFEMTGREMKYSVKVLWLQILPKKEEKPDSVEEISKKAPDEVIKEAEEEPVKQDQTVMQTLKENEVTAKGTENPSAISEETDTIRDGDAAKDDVSGKKETALSPFEKIKQAVNKFKYKFERICDKIRTGKLKAEDFAQKLTDERTQNALSLLLFSLKRLLFHIRPRKYRLYLRYGFEDPSLTGEIFGFYNSLYPIHMGKPDIEPDFENKCIDLDAYLKGWIQLVFLLTAFIRLYFDKDVKRLYLIIKNR